MKWRTLQKQNFTRLDALLDYLEIDPIGRAQIWHKPRFPLNLPRRIADKIKKNSIQDPLFRQFVPLVKEQEHSSHFLPDPVNDLVFRKEGKLLVKYEGRALLVCTKACAMNCRFCFRQNFDYETEIKGFEQELELIRNDPSLKEIILSGGDPLSLSNASLKQLFRDLEQIPHIKRIRFHSRFPIGIPERIDSEFLSILETSPLQIFFVLHVNHPQELDEEIFEAVQKIQRLGIPVLTQTVLLKGVNDGEETLQELMETLVDRGLIPYYLHQLDRVKGAEHFETTQEKGRSLIRTLQSKLSGYAVPRYVQEIPGEANKTSL